MPVEYLQIVSVPVRDQDQAKDFYVHGLAWDLLSDKGYELAEGNRLRWLEVRPHGGQTAITLVLEDDTMKAGLMKGLILRASSLDSTVADLASRGVATEIIQETPWARHTSFKIQMATPGLFRRFEAAKT